MSTASKARLAGREALPPALAALSLTAGLALVLGLGRSLAPMICGGDGSAINVGPLTLILAPWGLALGWLLMLAAMTPVLLIAPLRHLWDRSFADRRAGAMALFGVGYLGVWTAAGVPLMLAAYALKSAPAPLLLTLALALAWQMSPPKQAMLNRCHRRPPIAVFGIAAARDALGYGASSGLWCFGACWALMLAPLVAERHQLAIMAAVALFAWAERFDPPAALDWRWRAPKRLARALASRVHQLLV